MRRPRRPLIAEMNLTNLVDVTFALLIIFMITAPLLTQGIKVELPKLTASSIETINTISIHVLKNRTIYLEEDGKLSRIPLARFDREFRERYALSGQKPVVVNADKLRVTGNKAEAKLYHRHTTYPGGLYTTNFTKLQQRHPQRVLEKAVKGMLPKGPLGYAMLRKMKVYAGADHPHVAQQPKPVNLLKA